jgi:hypothetical protein
MRAANPSPQWVQICETRLDRNHGVQSWKSVEAIQSRELDHPYIVKTYAHTTVMMKVLGHRLFPIFVGACTLAD